MQDAWCTCGAPVPRSLARYYKKLSAPRLRWLKPTANRSGSNLEEKKAGPPVTPDLPLPDLPAVRTRTAPPPNTSHRTRLPLPKKIREPSTRSRREAASFHTADRGKEMLAVLLCMLSFGRCAAVGQRF